ncbi:NADH-quinone oxidoreductase subunit N [bacterium]|nr:NADH-quinone oxidoreductase subunit N [bacterium]
MNSTYDIWNIFIPCIILLIIIAIQAVFAMVKNNIKFYKIAKWISVSGIILSFISLFDVQFEPIYYAFSDSIMSNTYTIFMQALILIAALICVLLTKKTVASRRNRAFNFHAVFMSAVLAAMILVSVNDYLTMFVSMEFLSVACYFLIAFNKGTLSKEASFKYLLTNIVASSVFLFGVSYLYGITSSVNFTEINDYYLQNTAEWMYTISVLFIASGLLFKLAIFPFANWILDIYEGSSTSVAAFLSVVPKIAVFGILCRLLVFNFSYSFEFPLILLILASITAVWANLIAIRQRNIKRLLAASSSANASYMIFAASLVSVYNISTVIFYLVTYVFMNLGVFAAVILLENSAFSNKLYEFKNFAYTNPAFCFAFLVSLLGLAGMPLTSGFVAKIYLLSAIAKSGLIFLPFLILLVIVMVISMYYYIRIAKLMFVKDDNQEERYVICKTESASVILYICAIATIAFGILPDKIIEICKIIAYNI